MSYDPLIYGKDDTENIVSIEVDGSSATLYIQNSLGNITTKVVPNKYWILADRKINSSWHRLEGNLHYKWGAQFSDREDFNAARKEGYKYKAYSIYDPKESLMVKDGYTYFKGMKHKDVSVLSFDIETSGLQKNEDSFIYLIANTFRDSHGNVIRKMFSYDEYPGQDSMLVSWCNWVREINPTVLCGHNVVSYDLPYMQYIADKEGINLHLGRDSSEIQFEDRVSKFRKDQTQFYEYHKIHIYGREVIDTMFLSVKYDIVEKKYESYALKSIIKTEGLEKPGRVFYDAAKIKDNYKIPEEWEKIKAYAEFDGDDALALYDLQSPPFFYMTQSIPKSFQSMIESATGSQINAMMARSYLQDKHSLPKADESVEFQGATSLGNPGIYKNIFKVDVKSMYPNIILQYEVYDKNKDPNANFLKIVKTFTERRLKHKELGKKNKYYEDLQQSEKIAINSCYGFLGTSGLLFNSPSNASFVTKTGRWILDEVMRWAKDRSFVLVNADTDSISFCYPNGKDISESERQYLLEEINSLFPEKIKFEDDGYYPSGVVVKAKNYALFNGKKIKIKGSALRASTKEKALKEMIDSMINTLLLKTDTIDELVQCYKSYIKEAAKIKDITRWSSRKTITDKVMTSERANESKVRDAIEGESIVEGDRAYFYFKLDNTLGLAQKFDGDYNVDKMLEKVYKTVEVFETVLPVKELFPNYKLKRNKKLLDDILNEPVPKTYLDELGV